MALNKQQINWKEVKESTGILAATHKRVKIHPNLKRNRRFLVIGG